MPQNVEEVYSWIVDEVVKSVNDVFVQEGIDVSVSNELRESWSRRLVESGVMNTNRVDEHEWNQPIVKQERAAAAVQTATPQTATYHSSLPPTNMTPDSPGSRNRLAIGTPHFRAETFIARPYHLPGDFTMWPPHTPTNFYPLPGHGRTLTSLPRQQSTAHIISSSQAARPARASTGSLDAQLLCDSLRTGSVTHSNPIHVVANDNAIQVHQMPPLTTSPSPQVQVRISGKRKGPDDATSLMSHTVSPKAARRKSGDSKASRVIPQHDGADEHLPSDIPEAQQEQVIEPDLDDDSTLSDGDDDEESMESSNCLTAQYDKVSRIKNRWRCQLKHGIFHVDGRDFLFKTATGEFTF